MRIAPGGQRNPRTTRGEWRAFPFFEFGLYVEAGPAFGVLQLSPNTGFPACRTTKPVTASRPNECCTKGRLACALPACPTQSVSFRR